MCTCRRRSSRGWQYYLVSCIKTIKIFQISISRSREKEELISRLSKNPETSDVFKTTTNIRKFSTNSLRGDLPNGILDGQPRVSTRVSQSLNGFPSIQTARSSRGSQSGSYINGSNLSSHSNMSHMTGSGGSVDDTVKLRIVIN